MSDDDLSAELGVLLDSLGMTGLAPLLLPPLTEVIERAAARRMARYAERIRSVAGEMEENLTFPVDHSAPPEKVRQRTATDRVMHLVREHASEPLERRIVVRMLRPPGWDAKRAAALDNEHLRAIRQLVKGRELVLTDDKHLRLPGREQ